MRWGWYVTWQRQQKQCSFHIWCPVALEPVKCKINTKHLDLQATHLRSCLIKINFCRTPSCLWVWPHRIQQEHPEPSRATPKYRSSVWSKIHSSWWINVNFLGSWLSINWWSGQATELIVKCAEISKRASPDWQANWSSQEPGRRDGEGWSQPHQGPCQAVPQDRKSHCSGPPWMKQSELVVMFWLVKNVLMSVLRY